jgi:hypothetical protein
MLRSTQEKLFIKQYGERRTGTNYVRGLLLLNFESVTPLMHVLGDKHSAPAPLALIWESAAVDPDPNWHFVYTATFSAPSLTTDAKDKLLLAELARLAQPVTEAYISDRLKYVICAKHPYAWLESVARFEGWADWRNPLSVERISLIRDRCERFNRSYRSWLLLSRRKPEDTILARNEDLLASTEPFLAEVERRFSVRRRSIHPVIPSGHMLPAHWDYCFPTMTRQKFDPRPYIEGHHLQIMTAELAELLDELIDWPLMQEFGYAPM